MAIERFVAEEAALYRQAAAEFARLAADAVARRGSFSVALSGGSTPQGLYAALVADAKLREAVAWDRTLVFWGDERQVPPGHPDSNYGMAREVLLSKVPVPEMNVHRIQGELGDASEAAHSYEDDMRAALGLPATGLPRFDLVLLGLGADGHIASLFPGTEALRERHRAATANWVDTLRAWRITLTLPAINRARSIMFLVCGEDKAEVVKAVLEGPSVPEPLPARLVRPRSGRLLWFMDPAAARLLGGKSAGGRRSPRRRR
ncbi:MAG: 6-phosphogluconolactonase [Burkholderiales bacterium]